MHSNGRFDALVADACPLMNDGVVRCLEQGGYTVADPLRTVQALKATLASSGSVGDHLVILGPHLPEADSFDFCRSLGLARSAVRAILIAMDSLDHLLQTDATTVGAAGCLGHECGCDELIRACRIATAGYCVFSQPSTNGFQVDPPYPSEQRVLALLACGYRYQQVADELGLRLPTVRNHAQRLLDKFHVHSRDELVRRARRLGWVDGCSGSYARMMQGASGA